MKIVDKVSVYLCSIKLFANHNANTPNNDFRSHLITIKPILLRMKLLRYSLQPPLLCYAI
jgi:hypothetical protein